MGNKNTIRVAHLGGIDAGCQMRHQYDAAKPTLILVNSMTTTSDLYEKQFSDKALTDKMKVIAIELLGHGLTRTNSEHFTYWDTAIMNLQVMEALGIPKAFVLGTSQGGWITARMALLAPDRIEGIIPLGSSMDYESERTRKLGCWDGPSGLTPSIAGWTATQATPDFSPSDDYCNLLVDIGLGTDCEPTVREYWTKTVKANYQGEEGRKRLRMAAINLCERDGLHRRLPDIKCPVLWMHGTKDVVYSVSNAQEEIKLFTNSKEVQLVTVADGQHFLSASNPAEVNMAVVNFVQRWAGKHIR
ncbi:Alpha/Beta hydrolase protein [Rhexocercosporidium sp. MPI-PUGE-AT-0058]|nr:Alpha/Beta hydrolase protein [Rhexocercosporidium sp. MPI-PUGE-AT-0058]